MQRECASTTSAAGALKTDTSIFPHEAPPPLHKQTCMIEEDEAPQPLHEQTCMIEEDKVHGVNSEDTSHNGAVFVELLDLVCDLLQQHETRLCINMLEALKHTESTHVMKRLQGFVQEQLSTPSKGLHALAQRVQCFGGSHGGSHGGLHGEYGKSEFQKQKHCMPAILDGVQEDGKKDEHVKDLKDLEATRASVKSTCSKKSQKCRKRTLKQMRSNTTVLQAAEIRAAKKQSPGSRPTTTSQASLALASIRSGDLNLDRFRAGDSYAISETPSLFSSGVVSRPVHGSTKASLDEMDKMISIPWQDELELLTETDTQIDNENDWSDYTDDDDCEERFTRKGTRASLEKIGRQRCIVHPSSSGRLTWDCIGLAFVIGEGVFVPLSLGFDVKLPQWWQWGATSFFALDMITQFFTGFFHKGILIMQHSIIIKHYMRTFFVIDVIATLPWEVILDGLVGDSAASLSLARVARISKTLRLFRLLRIFRIVRMKELLMHLESMLSAYKIGLVLNLLKFPSLFLVLCHWAACLLGFLGQPDEKAVPHVIGGDICDPGGPCEPGIEGSPWLRRYGMDNYQAATQYLVALQSSAGLLTGAGMGVEPGFWIERIYVLGMMIGSFFLCAVVLSRIVVVADEMSKSQSELKKQLRNAKAIMIARKIPRLLQSKVTQYIEFQARACAENQASLQSFMLQLSPWLRLEIAEHMNQDVILHHPFFRELPNKLVKHICSAAQMVICAPGDIVVQQGNRATNMCFLVQGRLKVKPPRDKCKNQQGNGDDKKRQKRLTPRLLDPPCWIGDLCLFQDEVIHKHTVISDDHAELLVLAKEALLTVMEVFPSARRHYEAYKDQLQKSNDGRISTYTAKSHYSGQSSHQGHAWMHDASQKLSNVLNKFGSRLSGKSWFHGLKRKTTAQRFSGDQDNNLGAVHEEPPDCFAGVVCNTEADPMRRPCGPSVISLPHADHRPSEIGMPGELNKGNDDDDEKLLQ